MKCINATTIGKLIETHMEHDEQKFLSYANFIAESYEEQGEERSARIIRKRIDGTYKKQPQVTLDYSKKIRVPVYICATEQSTTAVWMLEGIGACNNVWVAVLSEIPDLKPFPLFSKVRVKGREIECYYAGDRLIQRNSNTLEFWLQG